MKNKFLYIIVILLFTFSCNNKNNSEESEDLGLNANQSVPKDIVINENLIQITDSIFSIRNKKKILSSISIWEFDKGFLKLSSLKSYKNDSVTYSVRSECDNYGRVIKVLITNPKSKELEIWDRLYDKYGNQTQLVAFKTPIIDSTMNVEILDYVYQYENEKIIKKTTTFGTPPRVLEEADYAYDDRSNEIQRINTSDLGKFKTDNIYDGDDNLIETINVNMKDNSIAFQIKHIYKNGLLVKTINGKGDNYIEPTERIYEYNENGDLVKESAPWEIIIYSNYDSFGNWTKKEYYTRDNDLQEVSSRTVIYK
ncbi:MAG: hypothetical protein RBR78_09575 [Flavobacteriaceae bacterium]|jgi:hypothetical protein|nr:hypothetical protein [Flavobacteriaceae bacterium]